MLILFIKFIAAVLADRALGEPRRWHPLVGFGWLASHIETEVRKRLGDGVAAGAVAWTLAVLPLAALAWALRVSHPAAHWLVDIGLLYLAIGASSLADHAQAVARPLQAGELDSARVAVSYIVSRDTDGLNDTEVATAAVESVLENGNDAIFAAVFWFLLLGGPGVLLFRLANTLDAMWGYRNPRYLMFGRVAARMDDVLGWVPARLTALSYALIGHTRQALRCWKTQAPQWKSPNAGPVMAAGAGALGVSLGAAARYHGQLQQRPLLGCGPKPDASTVTQAVRLMHHALTLWLGVLALLALIEWLSGRLQ